MPPSAAAQTSLRYHLLTTLLVVVSIALTIAGFLILLANERATTQRTFERVAADQAELIEQGIQRHIDAIYALAAFYASSEDVARDEFHAFTQPFLKRAPGIQALEWIPRVSAQQRVPLERAARSVFPDFHITERNAGALVPAGPRAEYFPVYFVEPYARNEAALGYDLASNKGRRIAIEAARDSGMMAATGGIRLIQEQGNEHAVLLFQPVYSHGTLPLSAEERREKLLGFVLAVIKPQQVLVESIGRRDILELNIELNDELASPAERRLFSRTSPPGASATAATASLPIATPSGLQFVERIDFGDRRWSINVTPAAGHFSLNPSPRAWAALASGLAFSALLAVCMQIVRTRVLAVMAANEEANLSRKNLAAAQRIAQIGSWEIVLNETGGLDHSQVHWSDEIYRLLGYEPGEIEAKTETYFDAIHPDDRDRFAKAVAATLANTEPWMDEYRIIRRNGETRVVLSASEILFGKDGKPRNIIGTIQDITERYQRQRELQRFRAALDVSGDAILLVDRDTHSIIDVNETACRMFGYPRDELLLLSPSAISTSMRNEELTAYYDNLVASGEPVVRLGKARRKDGNLVPVEATIRAQHTGDAWIILLTFRDISARLASEQIIADHAKHQGLIAALGQRALESNVLGELLQHAVEMIAANLQADCCNVLELEPDRQHLRLRAEIGLPKPWIELGQLFPVPPGSRSEQAMLSRQTIVVDDYAGVPLHAQLANFKFSSGMLAPILGATGISGLVVVSTLHPRHFSADEAHFLQSATNILAAAMERHSAEQKLSYLAQFDSLTGLPNRHMFHDQLTGALVQREAACLGCMFVDLDRFKYVNDTFGHAVGDQLLVQVTRRLRQCVRSADVVGRLGGDEFAILLSNLAQPEDARLVAQKIIDGLVLPFDLDGHAAHVTASIGIALYPVDGDNAGTLLKNADTAMYLAKDQGRNTYQFYLPHMNERALQRQQLETGLHGALGRQEFTLLYQPKVDLAQGVISGFEALLRWQHPVRGLVTPVEFIPVLEDTGLIVPVGQWVLQTACNQIKAWQAQGIQPRPIAVNISARQYQQQHLDAMVAQIRAAGIDPGLLKFELTESLLMQNADETGQTLSKLKAAGVRLSVDDFGTGYSSLAYLKRFPLDEIKIDRAFIRDVTTDPDDAEIVMAIIRLAHSLRLRVVAEGVETEAQLNFLRAQGCDEMQGYYFATPQGADDCTRMLIEDRRMLMPGLSDPLEAPGVLVVDDDPNDLVFIKRALERESYRVLLADNARAAFDLLSMHRVDVIISDHAMPGMSGTEFLAHVRKLYPDAIRIVLSGSGDADTVTDAVNAAGVHKYLSKDLNMSQIVKAVRDAIQQRREAQA